MRGGIPVCGRWQVEDACVGSGGGRFRVNGERVIIGSSRWQVGGECVDVGGGCCGFKEEPIDGGFRCGGSRWGVFCATLGCLYLGAFRCHFRSMLC